MVEPLAKEIKGWLEDKRATGRIYINEIGVNGQLCMTNQDCMEFRKAFQSSLRLKDIKVKVHSTDFNVFRKLRVRYGKLLENLNSEVNLGETGEYLNNKDWNKTLDEEPDSIILDIRNDSIIYIL